MQRLKESKNVKKKKSVKLILSGNELMFQKLQCFSLFTSGCDVCRCVLLSWGFLMAAAKVDVSSLKMFLKTLLWPLATLRLSCGSWKAYFSLFRFCINWVWSLCFLLSKKKIVRRIFLEFSRISLKMKTHSVILWSYCCSHFAMLDSRQLRIFQHGLNFA